MPDHRVRQPTIHAPAAAQNAARWIHIAVGESQKWSTE